MSNDWKPTCSVVKVKPWSDDQGDFVEINASDFDAAKHERYDEPAAVPPPPPPTPPPPPSAPDPLAGLPANWKEKLKPGELLALARVASGREPDNREQAVQMIEAALAARAAK